MTVHQREPVDPGLLADTVRVFGTAIEYRGQVLNPMDVVVHTNGMTDTHRLSLVWSVVSRWSRPDCAPTEPEAEQLLDEIREVLAVAPEPVDVPHVAIQSPLAIGEHGPELSGLPVGGMVTAACSCLCWAVADIRTATFPNGHHEKCDGHGNWKDER